MRIDGWVGVLKQEICVLKSCRVSGSGLNGAVVEDPSPNEKRGKALLVQGTRNDAELEVICLYTGSLMMSI